MFIQNDFAIDEQTVLVELAELFKPYGTLYLVGGAVRDQLMGKRIIKDIDIAAPVLTKDVQNILKGTKFKIITVIDKTGTAMIKCGECTYQYTAFRKDVYKKESGEHTPEDVVFVKDIKIDALRRDFKMNAIYKNILSKEIIDPLNGIEDIKNKVITTTRDPESVFEEDGLRLLRLCRFAGTLNFEIEKNTSKSAKKNRWRIQDIANERIFEEIDRMINPDACCGDNVRSKLAILYIFKLGLNEYIFPKNLKEHAVENLNGDCDYERYASLFLEVPVDVRENTVNEFFDMMGGHKKLAREVSQLVMAYDSVPKEKDELIWYIIRNINIIKGVLTLKRNGTKKHNNEANLIDEMLNYMKVKNIPCSARELPLNGIDLKNMGIKGKFIGVALEELWKEYIQNENFHKEGLTKQDLRNMAKEYITMKYKREIEEK